MQIEPGRVAVVTGGASGIGFALAAAAAGRGMRAVLADVRADALEAAAAAARQRGGGDGGCRGRLPARRRRACRAGRVRARPRPAGLLQRRDRPVRPGLGTVRGRLGTGHERELHGYGAPAAHVPAPAARGRRAGPAARHRVDGLGHRPGRDQPDVAAKHALLGLCETVNDELAEAGADVRVTLLMPGKVATGMSRADDPDAIAPDEAARIALAAVAPAPSRPDDGPDARDAPVTPRLATSGRGRRVRCAPRRRPAPWRRPAGRCHHGRAPSRCRRSPAPA